MNNFQNIKDLNLENQKVLLRVDLNVPIDDKGIILDDSRIKSVMPTIEFLVSKKAKIILISHLGRPSGMKDPKLSLRIISDYLKNTYKLPINYADDCIGDKVKLQVNNLSKGEILLLENLRFYNQEEKNEKGFAKQLADLADLYINDAFSCSHRKHASIDAITEFLPSYPGFSLTEEVKNLNSIFNATNKPLIAIIGGKKISSKIGVLNTLLNKVNHLVIGGAMANTFLKAQGLEIGNSYYEKDHIITAKNILKKHSKKIVLPSDVACLDSANKVAIFNIKDLNEKKATIYDIGTSSCIDICNLLDQSKTIIWNGPLGLSEDPRFSVSSKFIARHIAKITSKSTITIAGGGDVIAAINQAGVKERFSYISTGGGAFLEYLEDQSSLPGINRLTKNNKLYEQQ